MDLNLLNLSLKYHLLIKEPLNTWQKENPREYGFYANVNPNVIIQDGRKKERVLGSFSNKIL